MWPASQIEPRDTHLYLFTDRCHEGTLNIKKKQNQKTTKEIKPIKSIFLLFLEKKKKKQSEDLVTLGLHFLMTIISCHGGPETTGCMPSSSLCPHCPLPKLTDLLHFSAWPKEICEIPAQHCSP